MMRKLSVASITSNFTKRSGGYVSFAATHHPADDKRVDYSKCPHAEGWQSIVPESCSNEVSDDAMVSRLSVIQDENFPFEEKFISLTNTTSSTSPTSALKRLATLNIKKSLQPDGSCIIIPPLRTSSANGVRQIRAPAVCEGNENKPQLKHSRWAKATGMNRGVSTEGIRAFFR